MKSIPLDIAVPRDPFRPRPAPTCGMLYAYPGSTGLTKCTLPSSHIGPHATDKPPRTFVRAVNGREVATLLPAGERAKGKWIP